MTEITISIILHSLNKPTFWKGDLCNVAFCWDQISKLYFQEGANKTLRDSN